MPMQIYKNLSWSVVLSIIGMTSKKSKPKWNHKAVVEGFHYIEVLNILTSFIWSIRIYTIRNCCRLVFFFFHSTICQFLGPFYVNFLRKSRARKRDESTITRVICTLIYHVVVLVQLPRVKTAKLGEWVPLFKKDDKSNKKNYNVQLYG